MKRIKIWADYNSSGLFYMDGTPILRRDIPISDHTWNDLQAWVVDYEMIIPLSLEERKNKYEEIFKLDKIGMELVQKIRLECEAQDLDAEFIYYSEGLMKYIEV